MEQVKNATSISNIYQSSMIKREVAVILALILHGVFNYSYISFVNAKFAYMHFDYSPNLIAIVFSYMIVAIIAWCMPKQKTPSTFFLHFQFIIIVLPMLSIWAYARNNTGQTTYLLFILGTILAQSFVFRDKQTINEPILNNTKELNSKMILLCDKLVVFALCISFIVFLLSAVYVNKPSLVALDLTRVYEIRSSRSAPSIILYASSWCAKIINPFAIGYYFYRKKGFKLLASIVLQILFYMIFAYKAWLFYIPLVLVVSVATKSKSMLSFIYLGCIMFILLMLIAFKLDSDFLMLPSLFVRRVFFTPANIQFLYYDFFRNNPFALFGDSRLGALFRVSILYPPQVSKFLGEHIYSSVGGNIVTGYWADGYANLGYMGIVFNVAAISMVISVLNNLSKTLSTNLVIAVAVIPFFSFTTVSLFTNMLTGGMFILFLLAAFLDRKRKRYQILLRKKDDFAIANYK